MPFLPARQGNVLLTFALAAAVLAALIGLAVDYGRVLTVKEGLQHRTDAAILALGKSGLTLESDMRAHVKSFLDANNEKNVEVRDISIREDDKGKLTLSTIASVPLTFMAAAGMERVDVRTEASILRGARNIELVMVVDQSSSMYMNGGWLVLRKAAAALLDELTYAQIAPENVKVALVPYGSTVNVKGEEFDWAWIDRQGRSRWHGAAFERDGGDEVNIFDLFDRVPNADWRGCVEERPGKLFISDAPPEQDAPDTLWVPYFAPDESDSWQPTRVLNDSGRNNWLEDDPSYPTDFDNITIDERYDDRPYSEELTSEFRFGPNANCPLQPIIPLTTDIQSVQQRVLAMQRPWSWGTNHAIGLMWGLRVLTPGAPYDTGASINDPDTVKILVMMTDGEASPGRSGTPTRSAYSASGYLAEGRRGTTDVGQMRNILEADAQEACKLIKEHGITLYTFTYRDRRRARVEMTKCATSPRHAYFSSTAAGFVEAFEQIGEAAASEALRLVE